MVSEFGLLGIGFLGFRFLGFYDFGSFLASESYGCRVVLGFKVSGFGTQRGISGFGHQICPPPEPFSIDVRGSLGSPPFMACTYSYFCYYYDFQFCLNDLIVVITIGIMTVYTAAVRATMTTTTTSAVATAPPP